MSHSRPSNTSRLSSAAKLLGRSVAFALSLVLIPILILAVLSYVVGNEQMRNPDGMGYNDDRLNESIDVISTHLNGSLGSLLLLGSGCLAILTAAFRRYSLALGFLILMGGVFVIRALIDPLFACSGCARPSRPGFQLPRPPEPSIPKQLWDYWVHDKSICGDE